MRSRNPSKVPYKDIYASGLLWAWGYLVHFASPAALASQAQTAWSGFSDVVYLISIFLGYILMVSIFGKAADTRLIRLSDIATALMVASAFALVVMSICQVENSTIVTFCSVLAGIGIGVCSVVWGVPYSRINIDSLENSVLSWFPAFGVVFLIIAASTTWPFAASLVLGSLW